ncbi:MAG: flagellar assembly protein FliW [candidate division FCPU426 bacterium]
MIRIESRHFGTLEVEEGKILRFPRGLVGFADATSFCLLSHLEAAPYQWLQGVTRPDLAFIVVPMAFIDPAYQLDLGETERQILRLNPGEQPLVLGIVTIPEDPLDAMVNKLAPLVLNENTRLGHQVINESSGYRTRHVIREELGPRAREGENHVGAYPQEKAVIDAR